MVNREKQAEVLRRTQAKRKEQKDENERLRIQLKELTNPNTSSKVVRVRASQSRLTKGM